MASKKKYTPPAIVVEEVRMESSIANGSQGAIEPSDVNNSVYDEWADDEQYKDFNW